MKTSARQQSGAWNARNHEPGGGEVKMCLPKSMELLHVGKLNGSSRPVFCFVCFVPGGRGLPSRAGLVPGMRTSARRKSRACGTSARCNAGARSRAAAGIPPSPWGGRFLFFGGVAGDRETGPVKSCYEVNYNKGLQRALGLRVQNPNAEGERVSPGNPFFFFEPGKGFYE